MPRVQLRHLTKRYGRGTPAVADVSIDIADGEFVVLLGPSGCGKSTLLRMVAGLETVSDGTIAIGSRDVTHLPARDRDVAMVFQSYALYPHLSVAENLAFPLKMRKLPRAEISIRVAEAARWLQLDGLLDRRPSQLSGGQQQRVALGRVMVRDPAVFLFDEPLSNLDALLRTDARTEIRKLHRARNATILYVTHDQSEAMTLGDRIAILDRGTLQQLDTPRTVYDRPANTFVAGFLGSPGMNLLPARIRESIVELLTPEPFPLGIASELLPGLTRPDGTHLTVGIRPETLTVAAPDSHEVNVNRIALMATVIDTELLGAETLLHTTIGESRISARLAQVRPTTIGASVTLSCATSTLRFFDINGTALPMMTN